MLEKIIVIDGEPDNRSTIIQNLDNHTEAEFEHLLPLGEASQVLQEIIGSLDFVKLEDVSIRAVEGIKLSSEGEGMVLHADLIMNDNNLFGINLRIVNDDVIPEGVRTELKMNFFIKKALEAIFGDKFKAAEAMLKTLPRITLEQMNLQLKNTQVRQLKLQDGQFIFVGGAK